ncbi:hypothetical protein SCUCBS95973_007901 [Sporothrix curviconia]|uniref:Uncharacterized protein n=1 Tax=Sporothrix curviconia TaxID=1260050 RepID=A0ABP0CH20_9PEZI
MSIKSKSQRAAAPPGLGEGPFPRGPLPVTNTQTRKRKRAKYRRSARAEEKRGECSRTRADLDAESSRAGQDASVKTKAVAKKGNVQAAATSKRTKLIPILKAKREPETEAVSAVTTPEASEATAAITTAASSANFFQTPPKNVIPAVLDDAELDSRLLEAESNATRMREASKEERWWKRKEGRERRKHKETSDGKDVKDNKNDKDDKEDATDNDVFGHSDKEGTKSFLERLARRGKNKTVVSSPALPVPWSSSPSVSPTLVVNKVGSDGTVGKGGIVAKPLSFPEQQTAVLKTTTTTIYGTSTEVKRKGAFLHVYRRTVIPPAV